MQGRLSCRRIRSRSRSGTATAARRSPAQLSLDVDMGLDQRQAKESVDPDRNLRGLRPQDILPNFFTKPL